METNLMYDMYVPTRVMFGAGMLDKLNEQPMPGRRALIVISNGKSTRANGYLSRTEEQLHKAGVETVLFDGVMPNPTVSNVDAGAKAAREHGCDFLVALGGGSVMDCTKAIAVMATNDGELWDYVPIGSGKGKPIAVRPLPIIAITTTAGTGSETDNSGVITREDTFESLRGRCFTLSGPLDCRSGADGQRAADLHGLPGFRRPVPRRLSPPHRWPCTNIRPNRPGPW